MQFSLAGLTIFRAALRAETLNTRTSTEMRFPSKMKIGNPIKRLVKISERRGCYVVTSNTLEIVTPTLRSARRLGVVLRRVMDVAAIAAH